MDQESTVKILKAENIQEWNTYREKTPDWNPRLIGVNLAGAKLKGINLSHSYIRGSELQTAELEEADFEDASLIFNKLERVNLRKANLKNVWLNNCQLDESILDGVNLRDSKLKHCKFAKANLRNVNFGNVSMMENDFTNADLSNAVLTGTRLNLSIFSSATLTDVNFAKAKMGRTLLVNSDLSEAKNLESVEHEAPSTIGLDTLVKSKGKIPEAFLKGCGLSDWEIRITKLYSHDLSLTQITDILYDVHQLRAYNPIQICPVFISYSHADSEFVDKLEDLLNKKHIRWWRDIHDAPAGPLEKTIDLAMSLNPTVILVLSEASVKSDWVEYEASKARELERTLNRHVLCPIALDDSWETCNWPGVLRRQIQKYNILDFSAWKDEDTLTNTFERLISGLKLFYTASDDL
jgi:uncharacterized protein YjbI with pentapeptide repeats